MTPSDLTGCLKELLKEKTYIRSRRSQSHTGGGVSMVRGYKSYIYPLHFTFHQSIQHVQGPSRLLLPKGILSYCRQRNLYLTHISDATSPSEIRR